MSNLKVGGIDAAFWTYATSFSTMAAAAAFIASSLNPVPYEDKGFHVEQFVFESLIETPTKNQGKHWLYLSLRLQRRELANRVSNAKRADKLNTGIALAAFSPVAAAIVFAVSSAAKAF